MKREQAIRKFAVVLGFLVLFFGIPASIFHGVRAVDSAASHPILLSSGSFVADVGFDTRLHPLILPSPDVDSVSFCIDGRSDESLTLAVENLYFPHRIFRNGELVSQNIDSDAARFDSAMHCKEFVIFPHSLEQTFCFEGATVKGIRAYLARSATMRWQQRVSGELNSFLIIVVIAIGLLSLIVSVVQRHLNRLSIAVMLAFVFCLIKVALQHTSPILIALFPIPPESFQAWFIGTTIGFSFSLFLVYGFFFDVRPQCWFYLALAGYAVVMLVNFFLTVFGSANDALLPLILLYRVLLFVWILGVAVLTRQPFAKRIFFAHAVSDGLIAYYAFLNNHPSGVGSLAFYVDIAFLGFSIQFIVALILLVCRVLRQSRDYHRLLMLRGLEHDLKIPLSVIKLNHQMMRRYSLREEDEKGMRFAGAIDRALAELDGMIQNLRYQLESRPHAKEPRTELAGLFAELQSDFQAVCSARHAVFAVAQPALGLCVAIESDVLKRILYNLLDNCFKYGRDDLQVSLVAEGHPKKVSITVRDNGPGMIRSQRRKVTDLFYKADPARRAAGLGIGLHVVRHLIHQNHGALAIKSTKGEGTAIIVTLPQTDVGSVCG